MVYVLLRQESAPSNSSRICYLMKEDSKKKKWPKRLVIALIVIMLLVPEAFMLMFPTITMQEILHSDLLRK